MEILDIVDDDGNPTGKQVERIYAHANGIQHRTSHVWLLRYKNQKLQILLQLRSHDKDSYPDCYDISSAGHIPSGCDWKESAVRELKEELGVECKEEDLIEVGIIHTESKNIFHDALFHNKQVSKVLILWCNQDTFNYQIEELAGTLWMDFEDCYKAIKNNTIKHCVHIEELDFVREYINAKDRSSD